MFKKNSSEKDNEQVNNNSQNKEKYEVKITKPVKFIIHQQNIVKSSNFQINNNYLMNTSEGQNLLYSINTSNINDEKLYNKNNILTNSYSPLTERYRKEKLFIYQKRLKNDKNYNNNYVHFIKPTNINNYNNNIFKKGNTPRISKHNIQRRLKYNYSSKGLFNKNSTNKKELNSSNENNNEENSSIFSGNAENYKILNVKKLTHSKFSNFNLETPNNIKLHTIVYTSKNKDKDKNKCKTICEPKNLFRSIEKKKYTIGEPDKVGEINCFDKRKINYIKEVVFIQKYYRNYKKGDKLNLKYGKKYANFYCSINLIQSLLINKYWKLFKKRFKLDESSNSKSKKMASRLRNKSYKNYSNINIEKLIKEKEDLEKKLNDVIKENSILKKKINSSNKDLISKNLALTEKLDKTEQKTKQLQKENEQYLSQYSKTKDKYTKIENEIININKKLKTTHFRFIIEKKEMKRKQILNMYFKRFKEIIQKPYRLRSKRSNNINDNGNDNDYNLVKLLSSAVKTNTDEYITKKNEEEVRKHKELLKEINEKNELIKKRTKLLIDLIYKKDKEKTKLLHSCFFKFYYKGMIKSGKLENNFIWRNNNIQENKIKEEEEMQRKKEEEEKNRRIEEEKRRKEEEERRKFEEEEREKREEEERKIKEEEIKLEEERKKEEDTRLKEQMRKMNKINMNRRKKLKKLLLDERKQNLEIKRQYFKKFHFRVFFFSSNYTKKNYNTNDNDDDNFDGRNNDYYLKNIKMKLQEEKMLNERKEKEELMKKRISILQTLLFKKDRKIIIIKKNVLEKWNLKAKLISLGPKKKLIGKSTRKGDSKRKGISKKGKHESGKNIKINKEENKNNNEDEKEKNN